MTSPDGASAPLLELSIERHIAARPAIVWRVMTERLAEWWCPKPWRTDIVELDWRPGGRCSMVMRGPDGEAHPSDGVFLEVTPGVRWVSTDSYSVGWVPQSPFMTGIWEIAADGDGTRYRASARHWDQATLDRHVAMGFEDGWRACADQLAALVEEVGGSGEDG